MLKHRGNILLGLIFFIIMFLVPFLSFGNQKSNRHGENSSRQNVQPAPQSTKQFKILDRQSGQILTVGESEFLYGAVAAEMSPAAEPEALKAQAVACFTYYSRLRSTQKQTPDSSLNGADFSADTQNWGIYVSKEQMQKRWGKNFDTYYKNISSAVDPVCGQALKCGGELIDATYYAISSGNTEASEDIWGGKRAYLVSVASPGDVFAGGYQTTVTLAQEDFKSRVLKAAPSADLNKDASNWIGKIERTTAGSVKSIIIGGQKITGNQARTSFGLRSANFTVSFADGKFTFIVKGYGHGVGMSQTGAQYMAKQGATYKQILSWYYPSAVLTAAENN